MTIDPAPAPFRAPADELVQFRFSMSADPGLLERARAELASAPAELCDAFERAMRAAGFASALHGSAP